MIVLLLSQYLVEMGLYEGEEQSAKREEVLREIDGVTPFVACYSPCLLDISDSRQLGGETKRGQYYFYTAALPFNHF